MKEILKQLIEKSAEKAGFSASEVVFSIEHPADLKNGDYSANIAMVLAKEQKQPPHDIAKKIAKELESILPDEIKKVEVAGQGFINFYLSPSFFKMSIKQILNGEMDYGRNKNLAGKNILIEYTDPNPFKQFHIGHLMSNAIGESIARLLEWNGADVKRVCYQGDVGLHVAKAIWAMEKSIEGDSNLPDFPADSASVEEKAIYLSTVYTFGAKHYAEDEIAKSEIIKINMKVYELYDESKANDDQHIVDLYNMGREWSLQHFDDLYAKLGTNFVQLLFESQMSKAGIKIVSENVPGVFEKSDGAIIYNGGKEGLHTRVFINSLGLPTYETKDIGAAIYKEDELSKKLGDFDKSIIVTANEQKEYFKVLLSALSKLRPDIAQKTAHISHGMLRFADGKMSSREGNTISGEGLISETEQKVEDKINSREADIKAISPEEKKEIKEIVAIGAIKYSILKQAIGKNIIYDLENSVSFDGDSGPYLQYTYTRAKSIVDRAIDEGILFVDASPSENRTETDLERIIYRLPEEIESAYRDLAPQQLVTFVVKVCSEFNSYYASNQIIDGTPEEAYKLSITKATMHVIQNTLKVLGIRVPEKM